MKSSYAVSQRLRGWCCGRNNDDIFLPQIYDGDETYVKEAEEGKVKLIHHALKPIYLR